AGKLRQRTAVESKPGDVVSTFLGRSGAWSAPLIGDAQAAFKAALRLPAAATPRTKTSVRLGTGRITRARYATHTGDVFAGFLSGDVVWFRPRSGEIVHVKSGDGLHVNSLATDPDGSLLFVLQVQDSGNGGVDATLRLNSYLHSSDDRYRYESTHIA